LADKRHIIGLLRKEQIMNLIHFTNTVLWAINAVLWAFYAKSAPAAIMSVSLAAASFALFWDSDLAV
jgi:hypothetical protein